MAVVIRVSNPRPLWPLLSKELIVSEKIDFAAFPDPRGHFGRYGGRFVSETLMAALEDLEAVYNRLKDDPQFQADFDYDMAHYVGRPSPLYFAERLSKQVG